MRTNNHRVIGTLAALAILVALGQQLRAERFDPYPEVDTGPEVVGGRPRDYQVPMSEPARAQQWRSPFGIYGR